jgi:hypothetical protein
LSARPAGEPSASRPRGSRSAFRSRTEARFPCPTGGAPA